MRRSLSILAAVLALAAGPAPGLGAAEDIGQVKVARGAVRILREGREMPATPGARVRAADVVVTGPDGSAGITFADNSLLSVGPNSRLTLDRFVFDPTTHDGAFESTLNQGTLAAVSGSIAKRSPDAMRVKTPAAVLGVRGTEFAVSTAGDAR